jgi:tetratricopeptide (TPR) repeat protein
MEMQHRVRLLFAMLLALPANEEPAHGQVVVAQRAPERVVVSPDQLLDLADRASRSGDFATVEKAYRTMFADTSVAVRSEARFRLAMLYTAQRRLPAAAILLREILDEQPEAQRVRLELAHVLDLMGDEAGARRALREAQAGGLPPEVARMVDRYSAALRAQKPIGASIDMALAPDSNINRATRSDTLGTVLGDFALDQDARQRSGVGLALRGQAYARIALDKQVNMLARVSSSADLYRASEFNDVALAASLGPELRAGADRISFEAGGLWRWYGGAAYSRAATLGLSYFHPMGRKSQLRATANVALVDNRRNRLLDGQTWSASLGYERAISQRAGLGLTLSVDRQALRDPGYSTWGGQAALFAYREVGPVTLVASVSHGHLKADERLLLFARARSDKLYRASLGATFRSLRVGAFAPFARATFERNLSTSEIYDYRRLRTEVGLTRAF